MVASRELASFLADFSFFSFSIAILSSRWFRFPVTQPQLFYGKAQSMICAMAERKKITYNSKMLNKYQGALASASR
jgi:hypothetical protein